MELNNTSDNKLDDTKDPYNFKADYETISEPPLKASEIIKAIKDHQIEAKHKTIKKVNMFDVNNPFDFPHIPSLVETNIDISSQNIAAVSICGPDDSKYKIKTDKLSIVLHRSFKTIPETKRFFIDAKKERKVLSMIPIRTCKAFLITKDPDNLSNADYQSKNILRIFSDLESSEYSHVEDNDFNISDDCDDVKNDIISNDRDTKIDKDCKDIKIDDDVRDIKIDDARDIKIDKDCKDIKY